MQAFQLPSLMNNPKVIPYTLLSRRLGLLYGLAGVILITLVVFLNEQQGELSNESILISRVINTSGRQRMLSQQLAKHVVLWKDTTRRTSRDSVEAIRSRFVVTQADLARLASERNFGSEINQRFSAAFKEAASSFGKLDHAVSSALMAKDSLSYHAALDQVLAAERQFLPQMDRITGLFEEATAYNFDKIQKNISLSNYTIGGMILVIALLVLTISLRFLKQYSNSLNAAMQDLSLTNRRLDKSLHSEEEKVEELRRLSDSLHKEKDRVEQLAATKDRFLSTMSHEIRTPLNAIIGSMHLLLQENPQLSEERHIHMLQFNARNLLSLINDILDFQKIEAGQLAVQSEVVALREYLEDTRDMWSGLAHENRISLQLSISDNLPLYVQTDQTRLGQILNNLLSNALKFTTRGMVLLKVTCEEERINFEVRDTGVGIRETELEKIFDRFYQVDDSLTQKVGGTGIGLAVTRELVRLLGGEISVKSKVGFGSVFSFYLPLVVPKDSPKPASEDTSIYDDGKGAKILLVEDNKANQLIAESFVKAWGFDCKIAEDGKEAVKMAREEPFVLILMDLRMPEMNGFSASKAIRELEDSKNKRVPIIALSASTFTESREQVFASGMNDFLSKPFDPKTLRQKILHWIAKGEV